MAPLFFLWPMVVTFIASVACGQVISGQVIFCQSTEWVASLSPRFPSVVYNVSHSHVVLRVTEDYDGLDERFVAYNVKTCYHV